MQYGVIERPFPRAVLHIRMYVCMYALHVSSAYSAALTNWVWLRIGGGELTASSLFYIEGGTTATPPPLPTLGLVVRSPQNTVAYVMILVRGQKYNGFGEGSPKYYGFSEVPSQCIMISVRDHQDVGVLVAPSKYYFVVRGPRNISFNKIVPDFIFIFSSGVPKMYWFGGGR